MKNTAVRTALLGSVVALSVSPLLSSVAYASPLTSVILSGDYIRLSVNNMGTLGQGGADPGLLFDANGTGTFDPMDDYLTPGSPFEGFSLKYSDGTITNNNSSFGWGSPQIAGVLTDESGNGADHRAVWTGTYETGGESIFTLTNDVSFDTDGKTLKITTTVKAEKDITGVSFSRQMDPDVNDSYTENTRGTTVIPEEDLVVAVSTVKGYVLSLYTNSDLTHNAGVADWSSDPSDYLSGINVGDGDFTIGLGFDLGDMLTGDTKTFTYFYLFGTDLDDLNNLANNAGGGGSGKLQAGDIINNLPPGETLGLDNQTIEFTSDFNILQSLIIGVNDVTFDTAGFSSAVDGDISGLGKLIKSGAGALILTGENSHGGVVIQQGSVFVNSDSAIGNGDVEIDGGTFGVTTSTTINHDIIITANGGVIDTLDHSLTLEGSISGDACLTKRGSGSLILQSNSSNAVGACVEEGTLAQNATFVGDIWVHEQGTLRGTGIIDGETEVAGRLAPGNSPGTLTFINSVTQLPGSVLQIDIDGIGTGNGAGNYSRVILTGVNSVYTADGTLEPVLRGITGSATNTYTPSIGQTFSIVAAEGGIAGTFDSLSQPTAGLAVGSQFEVFYGSHAIVLAVTPTAFEAVGVTRNGAAVGAVIDDLRSVNAALPLRTGLLSFSAAGVAQTLQELSGEIHADVVAAGIEGRRLGRDGVSQRLAALRHGGTQATTTDSKAFPELWVDFIGRTGRVEADTQGIGYRYQAGGVAIGADYAIDDNLRTGFGAAVIRGDVNARGLGDGDVNNTQLFAYGSWSDANVFVDATVAHSWDRYRTTRSVTLNSGVEHYSSRNKGNNWAADINAGTRFVVDSINIEPGIGLRWDQAGRDSVLENGAAVARLNVAKTGGSVAQGKVGARANTVVDFDSMTLVPEVRAYWLHDFKDIDSQVVTLQGQDFGISPAQPGRNAALLGLGLNLHISNAVQLFADYDIKLRSAETVHGLAAGLRVRF